MNYPLISEYIESIKLAEDNFDELSYLRPVLDTDGQPVMSSGNFAVVFKMKDERDGKLYAVRCFHRDQEGRSESYRLIEEELKDVESPYLVSFRYMDKELFVDSSQTDETEFPILLMDWVEGITLDKYLRENLDDQYALEMLAYRFSQLAQWLIPQPFAHGDLKPDNILVREDGTLVLVDYDGMYVPAMKGQKARELGSPDFRHPLRTEEDFDEHIDDFPLASILFSLKAISINPALLERYGATDRLLLSEKDYRDINKWLLLTKIYPSEDVFLNRLVSVLFIVLTEKETRSIPPCFFHISISSNPIEEILSTEVSDEDMAKAWVDEHGVHYSNNINKRRLLRSRRRKTPNEIDRWIKILEGIITPQESDVFNEICLNNYSILDGTKLVCDNAFAGEDSLYYVHLPKSVISIGKKAFSGCRNLVHIYGGEKVMYIGEHAFEDCKELKTLEFPKTIQSIGKEAFMGCENLVTVKIPNATVNIEKDAFKDCYRLRTIIVPQHSAERFIAMLPKEGFLIFEEDELINEYSTSVSEKDFMEVWIDNYNLFSEQQWSRFYYYGQDWIVRGENEILYSKNMMRLLKASLKKIWFENGTRIQYYSIIRGTQIICDKAFQNCMIETFYIPYTVRHIGNYAFSGCHNLDKLDIPDSVITIGNYAFQYCDGLVQVIIPSSIVSIGDSAFEECRQIQKIDIPEGVISIGDYAFLGCRNLVSISFPYTLTKTGKSLFIACENLTTIYIPKGEKDKFVHLLPQYKEKLVEMGIQEKEIESTELSF